MSEITPFPTQENVSALSSHNMFPSSCSQDVPMLAVEALPADCKARKITSIIKLGEKLRTVLAIT